MIILNSLCRTALFNLRSSSTLPQSSVINIRTYFRSYRLTNFKLLQIHPQCTRNIHSTLRLYIPKQEANISKQEAIRRLPKSTPVSRGVWITWKNLTVLAVTCSAILAGVVYVRLDKEEKIEQNRQGSIGTPDLGGPFDLIDHDGNKKTSEDFLGQWLLMYFGFVNCPDICPEELEKLATVTANIDADKSLPVVQPLFISVDWRRDKPAIIKKYCSEFSPRLLGLTGNAFQLQDVTRAYRMYYSEGPVDMQGDYLVDHSIFIFLIGPDGEFIEYFKRDMNADWVTAKVKKFMREYSPAESNSEK